LVLVGRSLVLVGRSLVLVSLGWVWSSWLVCLLWSFLIFLRSRLSRILSSLLSLVRMSLSLVLLSRSLVLVMNRSSVLVTLVLVSRILVALVLVSRSSVLMTLVLVVNRSSVLVNRGLVLVVVTLVLVSRVLVSSVLVTRVSLGLGLVRASSLLLWFFVLWATRLLVVSSLTVSLRSSRGRNFPTFRGSSSIFSSERRSRGHVVFRSQGNQRRHWFLGLLLQNRSNNSIWVNNTLSWEAGLDGRSFVSKV